MSLPSVAQRVRVMSQNSQFRKTTGVVTALDNTSYTDWQGNSPECTVGPFAIVRQDGAASGGNRFTEKDLKVLS
jgi:hypothetical protein